jgi:protein O-mannosyl-transferase
MNKISSIIRHPQVTGVGLLVALCFLAYFPVLHNGFIWDDDHYLTDNPFLNDLEGLKRFWFDLRSRGQYYPLVFTSFWIEHKVWALDPLGYHVDNVILHCMNVLILWRILALLEIPGSWLAAAIFAIHPVQVESVAWITERKNLLSGFFYFLSLYCFLRFQSLDPLPNAEEGKNSNKAWGLYGISFVFFVCALLSKTVTCTLPAVILLICWWKQNRIRKKFFLLTIPYFTVGLCFAFLTTWVEKFHTGALGPGWEFSFFDRFLIAGRALWFYIGKLVWPSPIIFSYPRWTIDDSIWWQYLYPLTFLFVIFILWYLRKTIGRGPLATVLFYAGSLFPALGFFNIYPMRYSFVADHFQYLSCIGMIVIFSSGLEKFMDREMFRTVITLKVCLLILLGNLTWNQGPVYKDLFSLWNDTIRKNPTSWLAHNNLGHALALELKYEEAIFHYRMVIKLNPTFAKAHYNLGNALSKERKVEEAISHYKAAIKLKPDYANAHNNLGIAMYKERKMEEAIFHYRMAIKLNPAFAIAHNNLGDVLKSKGTISEAISHHRIAIKLMPEYANAHFSIGVALSAEGNIEEALSHYRMAIKHEPGHAKAHNNLGNILQREQKTGEAISHYKIAIKLNPALALAHYNLGSILLSEQKTEEAISHYKTAIRLKPDLALAHYNLGNILLSEQKIGEAISHYKMTISLKPDHTPAHNNLKIALQLLEELEGF